MAQHTSGEKIERAILDACEGVLDEETTQNEIKEAIRDNVDFSDIVSQVIDEDTIQTALKAKVASLVLKRIDEITNLEELFSDDDEAIGAILDALDMNNVVSVVLATNETVKSRLHEKMGGLVVKQLESVDKDDLPDWDEFLELLKIPEIIVAILSHEDMQIQLAEKVKETVSGYISENLDETDLPENLSDLLEIPYQIASLARDTEFQHQVHSGVRATLMHAALNCVTSASDFMDLNELVERTPEIKRIVEDEIKAALHDRRFTDELREGLKHALVTDSSIRTKLANTMLGLLAHGIIDRMLGRLK